MNRRVAVACDRIVEDHACTRAETHRKLPVRATVVGVVVDLIQVTVPLLPARPVGIVKAGSSERVVPEDHSLTTRFGIRDRAGVVAGAVECRVFNKVHVLRAQTTRRARTGTGREKTCYVFAFQQAVRADVHCVVFAVQQIRLLEVVVSCCAVQVIKQPEYRSVKNEYVAGRRVLVRDVIDAEETGPCRADIGDCTTLTAGVQVQQIAARAATKRESRNAKSRGRVARVRDPYIESIRGVSDSRIRADQIDVLVRPRDSARPRTRSAWNVHAISIKVGRTAVPLPTR